MAKAKKGKQHQEPLPLPEPEAIPEGIITDVDEAIRLLSACSKIGLDLETGGLSPHHDPIAVVSMKGDNGITAILHVRGHMPDNLKAMLEREDILYIIHNGANFDLPFLWAHGIHTPRIWDTLTMESLLDMQNRRDRSRSLKASVARRLKQTVSKELGQHSWMVEELTGQQLRYCKEDVEYLIDLQEAQAEKGRETGQQAAIELELAIAPAVAHMVLNGLPVDPGKWAEYVDRQKALSMEYAQALTDIFGDINLDSWQQVKKAYSILGIELEDTTSATIEALASGHDDPEVRKVAQLHLDYKTARQRVKMYGEMQAEGRLRDNRLRGNFWQAGTDTGRFSCIAEGQPVMLPGGYKPIEQVDDGEYVYSVDQHNRLTVRRVIAKRYTGQRECIRVHWVGRWTGHTGSLVCTADHRIKTANRGWVPAIELTPEDILVFASRRDHPSRMDRPIISSTHIRGEQEQWIIKREYFRAPNHLHIHHKDLNSRNNQLDNLEIITPGEHTRLHQTKQVSRYSLLRMLAQARGRISYVTMDYTTYLKKCKEQGIPIRELAARYTSNGLYLSRGAVLKAASIDPRVEQMAGCLGIGTRKLQAVCNQMGLEYNHRLTRLEYVGVSSVYDLEVEDTHTFIVGEVAVHNSSNPNLQQVPRDMRSVFVAPPGYKVVGVDYAAIEARIAFIQANDTAGIEACKQEDIHSYVASLVFPDFPTLEKSQKKERRQQAKAAVFRFIFGGGWKGFPAYARAAYGVDVSMEEAEAISNAFFSRFEGLRAKKSAAYQRAAQGGGVRIKLPHGLMRVVAGKMLQATRLLNTMVQGTAGGGMKWGIRYAVEQGLDKYLAATVHDELVAVVPEAEALEYAVALAECMIRGMYRVIRKEMPVQVSISVADYWTKEETYTMGPDFVLRWADGPDKGKPVQEPALAAA